MVVIIMLFLMNSLVAWSAMLRIYFCILIHGSQVTEILKKTDDIRTTDDRLLLSQSEDIVQAIAKRERLKELAKQRHLEVFSVNLTKSDKI